MGQARARVKTLTDGWTGRSTLYVAIAWFVLALLLAAGLHLTVI
jgi:hypothetical protein